MAREMLRRFPLIDGHNDLPWAVRRICRYDLSEFDLVDTAGRTQTDLTRLREGGVGAQFWSVYVPSNLPGDTAVTATLEQIDFVHHMVARYPDDLALALTADDVERAFGAGRVASLIGAEGGQSIGCSLGALRALYRLGVRYMTLTHNHNTPWADSATDDPGCGGLTGFGRVVVSEMNRLGMLVDLSHISPGTMHAALDTSTAPVIFSHSSCRALVDHPRNVPDDVLGRLAENGGVCMVSFVPDFVSVAHAQWVREVRAWLNDRGIDVNDAEERSRALKEFESSRPRPGTTVDQVVDHLEHAREVAGVEHIGIGGDYDGYSTFPEGLDDVSAYPTLFAAMLERGWSEQECALVAGANVLRVMRAAEAVAADRAGEPPGTATMEDPR